MVVQRGRLVVGMGLSGRVDIGGPSVIAEIDHQPVQKPVRGEYFTGHGVS